MIKVLFVCHGNICRSAMAHSVMTALVRQAGLSDAVTVDSAAVSREETGSGMYPPAQQELRRHGIPIVSHRARQVTRQDYEHSDLLVVMDRSNLKLLPRCIGEDDGHKVRMLMDYTDRPGEVADPWYTDRFDVAYLDIEAGCRGILQRILNQEAL